MKKYIRTAKANSVEEQRKKTLYLKRNDVVYTIIEGV